MSDSISIYEPMICEAALYFLDGHYVFRHREKQNKITSKFVTSMDVESAFTRKERDSGWLAPGVIRAGSCKKGPWFVYLEVPTKKRKMVIYSGKDTTVIEIPVPPLLLMQIGETSYLYALASAALTEKSSLYHAPFPNIHSDGKICWGNSKPGTADAAHAGKIADVFFKAAFNQDLCNGKSKKHPKNVLDGLNLLHENQAEAYPVKDMVKLREHAAGFVEESIRRD